MAVGDARRRQARHRRPADRAQHHQQQRNDGARQRHRARATTPGPSAASTCSPARRKLPEQIARQLPAVKWFAAAGHINGGVSGTLRAEARDDEAAENLRDVVRGFLALAPHAGAERSANRARSSQSLQLTGTGKTVALSFTVPAEIPRHDAEGRRSAAIRAAARLQPDSRQRSRRPSASRQPPALDRPGPSLLLRVARCPRYSPWLTSSSSTAR